MIGPDYAIAAFEQDMRRIGCLFIVLVIFALAGIGSAGWWLYSHITIEVTYKDYTPTPAPYPPPQGGWHWDEEQKNWFPDPPKE